MNHSQQSKILLYGRGTGDLTDDDVEKRARENAVIGGRSPDAATENDRAEAWAELQGELLPATVDSDSAGLGILSRDPSEPVGYPGRQIANQESEDDSTAVERLANEGSAEAQHHQMLAARDREHRRARL